MNPTKAMLEQIAMDLAVRGHKAWRDGYAADLAKKGVPYAPRWKDTAYGRTWGAANDGKPHHQVVDGKCQVDIAALDLEELPFDWQFENLEDALIGLKTAEQQFIIHGKLDESSVLPVGIALHAAWVSRRYLALGLKSKEDFTAYEVSILELCVPYGQLTEDEQQKDLVRARMQVNELKSRLGI